MTERDLFRSIVVGTKTTKGIADALVTRPEKTVVRRRWGLVAAVNAVDSTIDVTVDGVTIPHVRRSAFYVPTVGELVWLDVVDTDVVAVSPIAPSVLNQFVSEQTLIVGDAPGQYIAYAKSTIAHTFNTASFTENTGLRATGTIPTNYSVKVSISLFMNYGGGADAYDANLAEFDIRANGTSIRGHELQYRAQAIGGPGQETFTAWTASSPAAGSTTFSLWTKRDVGARTFSILAGSELLVEGISPMDNTKRLVLRNP